MIPNFEPHAILPKLASLVSPNDHLLFSGNLAPGPAYEEGVRKVFPQDDNALTREWLFTLLLDLGSNAPMATCDSEWNRVRGTAA
jgi:hypothetical protein